MTTDRSSMLLTAVLSISIPAGAGWSQAIPKITVGAANRVQSASKLNGRIDVPGPDGPAKLRIEGHTKVTYQEVALHADATGRIDRVGRRYQKVDYRRTVNDLAEETNLRPEVQTVVVDRSAGVKATYSPGGPMSWLEIDLVRTHEFLANLEDFLPARLPAVGETWPAPEQPVKELTGLDAIEEGKLTCSRRASIAHEGRQLIQIGIVGQVQGRSREGRSRHQIAAAAYLDEALAKLVSFRATGKIEIIGPGQQVVGELDVEYQCVVAPLAASEVPELAAIPKEMPKEIVIDLPELAAQLKHGRDWLVADVVENRVLLHHGPNAAWLQIEPDDQTPTVEEFAAGVREQLESAGIKTEPVGKPQETKSASGRIGHFQFQSVVQNEPMALDYYVVQRQRRGLTLSGSLRQAEAAVLSKDLESIIRSVQFTRDSLPAPKPVLAEPASSVKSAKPN